MAIVKYNVDYYYDKEVRGWMRKGSNRIYANRTEAKNAAIFAKEQSLRNIRLTYEDVSDFVHTDDRPGTPIGGSWSGGTEAGRGMFDLFFNDWDMSYTMSQLSSMLNDDIAGLLQRVANLTTNQDLRIALKVVLGITPKED